MVASSQARKIIRSFPKDVREYFLEIDKKCQSHGITFKVGSGKNGVNMGGGRCGGYFDDTEKVLAISVGTSLQGALSILVHESSHMSQDILKTPAWRNRQIYHGYNRFFWHLKGEPIYKIDHATTCAVKIELEAEKMAVRQIKKRWLKYINLKKYIRESNAYLLSYRHMAKTGKWPVVSPCEKRISAHSPDKHLRSYDRVPKKLQLAFDKYL